MKRISAGLFSLALLASLTFGQQKKGKETTITGEIIDLQCYVSGTMGKGTGPEHKDCATDCAKGGIPLAILENKTGTIYMAGQTKSAMKGANEMLIPFIAQNVRVTGRVYEKGRLKLILITKVANVATK